MGWDDDCKRWGDDPADHRALDAWLTRSDEEVWGDVIDRYSRADAIADGVLVDATDAARELGIALPAALTSGAWEALGCEDPEQLARVMRAVVLALVIEGRLRRDVDRVDLVLRAPAGWVACWAAVGAGDEGEPVLTVMREGED